MTPRLRMTVLALVVAMSALATGAASAHHRADHGNGPPPGKGKPARLLAGFGARTITPVGQPPGPWKDYFWVNPKTGVWSEPFEDRNGNGCYDGVPGGIPEPHIDHPWNSPGAAGAFGTTGAFEVDGVTIAGDPGSTGKWDGLWANAGFGAKCALGAHDDTWARAVVLSDGDETVAMVSLDVVGFFNEEIQRAKQDLAKRHPHVDIDQLVVASTHTHEGVDTMGYWGQTIGIDGKSPAYQAFIRSQIIDAVEEAYTALQPATAKFAKVEHTVGVRDSRPPNVIDPWLMAAQFLDRDGTTIGTILEWSNHPEAQSSRNQLISSDFAHGARVEMERRLGGTAVYFSGSVGGLMTPLGANVPGYGTAVSWERTYEIGRLLAEAAIAALATAEEHRRLPLSSKHRTIYLDVDNTALRGLNAAGVFDKQTFTGGESWGSDPAGHRDGVPVGNQAGTQMKTEMIEVRVGPALFLTVPGELFPEIEIGGYGRPDCPAADTGRPYEPVIADSYDAVEYRFVLGLGQDELGYIVPGYDYWFTHLPQTGSDGDGLVPLGALEQDDPCGEGHYEETVSASSVLAPVVACVAGELAGRLDIWLADPACAWGNTHTNPYGIADDHGAQPGPTSAATAGPRPAAHTHTPVYRHPPAHPHPHPHDH